MDTLKKLIIKVLEEANSQPDEESPVIIRLDICSAQ